MVSFRFGRYPRIDPIPDVGQDLLPVEVVQQVVKCPFVELECFVSRTRVVEKLTAGRLRGLSAVPCKMSSGSDIAENSFFRRSSTRTNSATVFVGWVALAELRQAFADYQTGRMGHVH